MNEPEIGWRMARVWVAMKVPTHLGGFGVWRASCKNRPSGLEIKPRRQTHLRSTSAVSSWWLCTSLLSRLQPRSCAMSSSTVRPQAQENVWTPMPTQSSVLKCLVPHADVGGIGDGVQPYAAGLGQDAVEAGPGPDGGPKAPQFRVTGCLEGAADKFGQQSELGGCWRRVCIRRCAVISESAVHVSRCTNRNAVGSSKGVQVGGSCGDGSGRARCRGKEGRQRMCGKAGDAEDAISQLEMEL
jgi:hypothetical protein